MIRNLTGEDGSRCVPDDAFTNARGRNINEQRPSEGTSILYTPQLLHRHCKVVCELNKQQPKTPELFFYSALHLRYFKGSQE